MNGRMAWLLRRLAVIALSLLALLGNPPAVTADGGPRVVAARVSAQGTGARLVLDISESVRFGVFTATQPPRVVIDLDEVHWQPPSRIAVDNRLVAGVRHGAFQPGTSRVVIDCHRTAKVAKIRLLPDGRDHQLIVDLTDASPASADRPGSASRKPAARAGGGTAAAGRVAEPPHPVEKASIPQAPPPAARRQRIIVIDPGHGGVDPGAVSANGLMEKTVTLRIARQLRQELAKRKRNKVILTRERDRYIALRDRMAIARRHGADMFLSLHADSNPAAEVRGASVYTLSEKASDGEAAALAERENKADVIAGLDFGAASPVVTNILIDLAQRDTLNQSTRLARMLVSELGKDSFLLPKPHRFAGFAVLKAPDVPSVLIELGQLSNGEDERALRDDKRVAALTAAIGRAVDRYFERVEQMAQ